MQSDMVMLSAEQLSHPGELRLASSCEQQSINLLSLTPAKAPCWQGSFIYSPFVAWNVLEDSKSVRVKYLIPSSEALISWSSFQKGMGRFIHSGQPLPSDPGHGSFSLPAMDRSGPWPWQRGTEQEGEPPASHHVPPSPGSLPAADTEQSSH